MDNFNNWKNFSLNDLFEIKIGKAIDKNKIEFTFKSENSFRYISRKETENGLEGYLEYDLSFLNKIETPVITIGNETAKAFVQEESFFTGTKVNILTPKFKSSKDILFFIATLMTFAFKKKYSYSYTINSTKLKSEIIKLPVDSKGNPDWKYMKNYIKELWETKIPNLDEFRKSKNKVKIELRPILEWKEFVIKDIFNLKNSKPYHLDKLETELEELDSHLKTILVNYVTRTRENNGILKKFKVPETFSINNGNVISITAEGVYAFYQAKKFITGNKVYILSPKSFVLTPYIGAFIISILNFKILDKYSYSRARIGNKILNEKVKLPVDSNENPDWEYMETYIKSLPYSNKI